MALNLKIIRGGNPDERMQSIDGLLNSFDKKLQMRRPDDKLVNEVARLRQDLAALMDFLGLAMEPGQKRVVKQVRITNALDTNNP